MAIAGPAIVSEHAAALEHVREHGVLAGCAMRERLAGGDGYVEVFGLGNNVADRTHDLSDATRNHPHDGSVTVGHDRDFAARDAAITRLGHLVCGG
jgi:hypothetical protein